MPFLSVIIPTRNEFKRLHYCLPSLFNQTFQDFEIVLVEDPETTDKTKEYIESFKSSKINLIYHPKSMKMAAKRDYGVASAFGDYFYFVDADMEFPQNLLQEIHDLIEQNKAELVFVSEETPGKSWVNKMKNFEKHLASTNLFLGAARVYSKELYNKIGGYDKNLVAGEDGNLSDRALQADPVYVATQTRVKHYETVGVSFLNHLKKKFMYGITSAAYFKQQSKLVDQDQTKHVSRSKSSLQTYFFSPQVWRNPWIGIQFVSYKFLELSVLALGLIYGKVFSKTVINTR